MLWRDESLWPVTRLTRSSVVEAFVTEASRAWCPSSDMHWRPWSKAEWPLGAESGRRAARAGRAWCGGPSQARWWAWATTGLLLRGRRSEDGEDGVAALAADVVADVDNILGDGEKGINSTLCWRR